MRIFGEDTSSIHCRFYTNARQHQHLLREQPKSLLGIIRGVGGIGILFKLLLQIEIIDHIPKLRSYLTCLSQAIDDLQRTLDDLMIICLA